MKKAASIILATAIAVCSVLGWASENKRNGDMESVLLQEYYSNDFETNEQPETAHKGKLSTAEITENSNENYGKVLHMRAYEEAGDAAVALNIDLSDKPIMPNSGRYVLSYDFKYVTVANWAPYITVRVSESKNKKYLDNGNLTLGVVGVVHPNWYASYAKIMRPLQEWNSMETDINKSIEPSDKNWHNSTTIIDTNKNTIQYYYDGIYVGEQDDKTVGESLEMGLKNFQIQVLGKGFDCQVDLDNVFIGKINNTISKSDEYKVGLSYGKKNLFIFADNIKSDKVEAAVIDEKSMTNIATGVSTENGRIKVSVSDEIDENGAYMIKLKYAGGEIDLNVGSFDKEIADIEFINSDDNPFIKEEIKSDKPTISSNFSDIPDDYWAKEAINYLAEKKIIDGKEDGTFDPDADVTREEFAKMVQIAFFRYSIGFASDPDFLDLDKNMWYYKYVTELYKNGVIKGFSDTEFGVGESIIKQDAALILNRVIAKKNYDIKDKTDTEDFKDSNEISSYAKSAIDSLRRKGILSGEYFEPQRNATRAEIAQMIFNLLNA